MASVRLLNKAHLTALFSPPRLSGISCPPLSANVIRDFLASIFWTSILCPLLAKAEVELKVVQPWDAWIDAFRAELGWQSSVCLLQVAGVGSVVVGYNDGPLVHPNIPF